MTMLLVEKKAPLLLQTLIAGLLAASLLAIAFTVYQSGAFGRLAAWLALTAVIISALLLLLPVAPPSPKDAPSPETHVSQLQEQALQAELQALKAQIQPHFLFNALNRVNASLPAEQEAAREMIARLADTFRYALDATRTDLVPLGNELSFLRDYLQIEQDRFASRLQVHIDAPLSLHRYRIPPMLLQPLVENAVKHGIGPCIDGGSVTISCTLQDNKLRLTVSDTGAGYDGPLHQIMQSSGVGLRNTALRLEKLYNEPLLIARNAPGGLQFMFDIPIQP